MSWYVKAMGAPSAVAKAIEEQFARGVCAEPEETARQAAKTAVLAVLGTMSDDCPVLAHGQGSQNTPSDGGPVFGEFSMRVELLNSMLEAAPAEQDAGNEAQPVELAEAGQEADPNAPAA